MIERDTPTQLTLVPAPELPVRFRIDARTRERGIRHIAEIRAQLAERRARSDSPDAARSAGGADRPAA